MQFARDVSPFVFLHVEQAPRKRVQLFVAARDLSQQTPAFNCGCGAVGDELQQLKFVVSPEIRLQTADVQNADQATVGQQRRAHRAANWRRAEQIPGVNLRRVANQQRALLLRHAPDNAFAKRNRRGVFVAVNRSVAINSSVAGAQN